MRNKLFWKGLVTLVITSLLMVNFITCISGNNNIIFNNTLENNLDYGIRVITTCKNNTFANNTIKFNGNMGITLSGSGNNTIYGNIIYNSTKGIYLALNSHENLIFL